MQHPVELYFWPTQDGLKIAIPLGSTGASPVVKRGDIGKGE
ncbi:hypothetical protein [Neorhizobium lilium]|nr:hypothetical protein [Neorhizobium lilium]